ncbi:MAG: stage II sporulation protein M [Microcystaceae cyanobacterium]
MNIQRWIARREPNWQEAQQLLEKVEKKGLKSLPGSQIQRLASLYRSLCADLSRAKTFEVGPVVRRDLQQLTARAYNQIYQGSRHQEWQAVGDFYRWRLPTVIQETWVYTAIAFSVFSLGGLIAWWYSWQDPSFLALVVPEELIHKVRDQNQLWMGSILGNEPLASTGIMINNLAVSFRVVAGAMTAGIFTLYALFFNGLLIGAIAALVSQNQLAFPFWAFVFPHGALELPAIFLAGGAGLLVAKALIWPGNYRRVDALKKNAYQAAQLVFGIVPMLAIAGIIEGFISPNPGIPDFFKYLLGVIFFIGLLTYCDRRKITS